MRGLLMITNRKELKYYISEDIKPYVSKSCSIRFYHFLTKTFNYQRIRFMKHLRKKEYYKNKSFLFYFLYLYHSWRKNVIGNRLNWEIPSFSCGYGLHLGHPNIVINSDAKIGNNVTFNGNNCIGRKGNSNEQNLSPVIGNNVIFGFGSCAIGDVVINDGCIIGSNCVVVKSFSEKGIIIAGNPGREIGKVQK